MKKTKVVGVGSLLKAVFGVAFPVVVSLEDLRGAVDEALSTLTPREEKVIRDRYGLVARGKTLAEVGKEQGVSRERIGQIQAKALRKLRHPRLSKVIKGLLPPEWRA